MYEDEVTVKNQTLRSVLSKLVNKRIMMYLIMIPQ